MRSHGSVAALYMTSATSSGVLDFRTEIVARRLHLVHEWAIVRQSGNIPAIHRAAAEFRPNRAGLYYLDPNAERSEFVPEPFRQPFDRKFRGIVDAVGWYCHDPPDRRDVDKDARFPLTKMRRDRLD